MPMHIRQPPVDRIVQQRRAVAFVDPAHLPQDVSELFNVKLIDPLVGTQLLRILLVVRNGVQGGVGDTFEESD